MDEVEAQLHGGRELIDILPTRATGLHECLTDLARIDGDLIVNLDHLFLSSISRAAP